MPRVSFDDGTVLVVHEDTWSVIKFLQAMTADTGDTETPVPLSNVEPKTFKLLLKLVEMPENVNAFTAEDIFECMEANRFLNIEVVKPTLTDAFTRLITNNTAEQLRELFNLNDGFTADEKMSVKRQIDSFFRLQKRRADDQQAVIDTALRPEN